MNSDHSPIYLTITDKIIIKDQNPTLTYKHTDWGYFNYLLENVIHISVSLKTMEQLKEELNAFTSDIRKAAWSSTSIIKRNLKALITLKK